MSDPPWDATYSELANVLSPTAVSRYLSATLPWRLDRRQGEAGEIWSMPGDSQSLRGRIMLPLATDCVDFHDRFIDALRGIALISNFSPQELAENINSARTDKIGDLDVDASLLGRTMPRVNVDLVSKSDEREAGTET